MVSRLWSRLGVWYRPADPERRKDQIEVNNEARLWLVSGRRPRLYSRPAAVLFSYFHRRHEFMVSGTSFLW